MEATTDTGAALKGLQVRRRKLQAALELGGNPELATALEQVDKAIHDLTGEEAEPVVSEHALLRYLERVKGIDLDAVRDEILDGRRSSIRQLGSCKFKTGDGLTIVVKDRVVVTVMDKC